MTLSRFITLHAILLLALGIAMAIYGPLSAAFFGLADLPEGSALLYWNAVSFVRLYGAGLFGFGLVLFSLRGVFNQATLPLSVQRGVVFALALANLFSAIVATVQQFSIWGNAAGWLAMIVFTLLFIGYVYFLAQISRADTTD